MKKLGYAALLCVLMMLLCACGGNSAGKEHTHTLRQTVVPPSCTDGYTLYVCDECGYSYTDSYTAANGHVFESTVVDAACNEQKRVKHQCAVCGYSFSEQSEEQGGVHTLTVLQTVPPALHQGGYTLCLCTVCGEEIRTSPTPPNAFSVGLAYTATSGGAAVSGIGTCRDERIVIPSVNEYGQTVTEIVDGAFEGCQSLLSVRLADSVTALGARAFADCVSLESVEWGENLRYLGKGAFSGTALRELTFPDGIDEIPAELFAGCIHLQAVYMGDTITKIGEHAFLGCVELEEIVLPTALTRVEDGTFRGCSKLSAVTLPDSLQSVGAYAFAGTAMIAWHSPKELAAFGAFALADCDLLESVTLSQRLTLLPRGLFSGCGKLYEVELPQGLLGIGENAFADCVALETVAFPDGLQRLESGVFSGCVRLKEIALPSGIQSVGIRTFFNCAELERIELPATVTEIGMEAFSGTALQDLVLSEAVTRVEGRAFARCPSLVSVTLGGKHTELGDGVLEYCTALKEICIREGTTVLPQYALRGCVGLTAVTLPESLECIDVGAFSGCEGLCELTVPQNVREIVSAFDGCISLKKVCFLARNCSLRAASFSYAKQIEFGREVLSVPEGICSGNTVLHTVTFLGEVQRIGASAFSSCLSLKEITLPSSLTYIGNGAFYHTGLTSLTLCGADVELAPLAFSANKELKRVTFSGDTFRFGEGAFRYCEALSEVDFGGAEVTLGGDAFFQCNALQSVVGEENVRVFSIQDFPAQIYTYTDGLLIFGNTLVSYDERTVATDVLVPEGVEYLAKRAFLNCDLMRTLCLPTTLREIGEEAFSGCTRLVTVTFPDGVKRMEKNAFFGCTSLADVSFSDALEEIPEGTFGGCTALSHVTFGIGLRTVSEAFYDLGSEDGAESLLVFVTYRGTVSQWEAIDVGEQTVLNRCAVTCRDGTRKGILLCERIEGTDHYLTVDSDWTMTLYGTGEFSYDFTQANDAYYERVTKLVISEGITGILSGRFSHFNALEEVEVPSTLQSFPVDLFVNSPWYHRGEFYKDGLYIVGTRLLDVHNDLQGVLTLPEGLTVIGGYALRNCTAVTEVRIPQSVTYIGNYAFSYCAALSLITLPEGLTHLGGYAFVGCHALRELTVPAKVREVSMLAVSCNSLERVILLGETRIGVGGLVHHCDSLSYVVLGEGIVSLPTGTVTDCPSLRGMVIPASVTAADRDALLNIGKNTKLFFLSATNAQAVREMLNEGRKEADKLVSYVYSKEPPTKEGNFWHRDGEGTPTVWE